ncbi:hypothetical protein [Salipiger sp. 1_MG-2023]|uniref:hypothetical protein n=1 Tax=Salipiger sp. 1_MG-2023 TaxID=3062665 RepID=UPI0026E2A25D|nr:hypothetical protein [Salipiger sp. 1_MG-2023]
MILARPQGKALCKTFKKMEKIVSTVRHKLFSSWAVLSPAFNNISAPIRTFGVRPGLSRAATLAARLLDSRANKPNLMRRPALRRALAKAPATDQMRATVDAVLTGDAHDCASPALAELFGRIIEHWHDGDASTLGNAELLQLCTLKELVEAGPARAAELSDQFVHPDRVLEIRDRISEHGTSEHSIAEQRAA